MCAMSGTAAANAMADGILREVLLGTAADVSNAGLMYAGRTLRPCVFATASGTLQNSNAGSIILDRWRSPAGYFREQMPLA